MRISRPCLALCALLLLPGAAFAQDLSAAIAVMKGRVTVGGRPARAGAPLASGDEIAVERGEAVVMFGNTAKLRLVAGSRLKVEEHSAAATALTLQRGRLDAWVRGLAGTRLRVRAGAAVAHARDAVFSAGVEGGKSSFRLYEGEVGVADDFGAGLILTKGQRVEVAELGLGAMSSLPPGESAPAEPAAVMPATAKKGAPASKPADEAPESLPAPAAPPSFSSPVQEKAAGECDATVSPSAPCP